METFNNIYVYSLTPETATVEEKRILPVKWTNPVTGVQYSNLYLLSEGELNAIGWWKVFEEHFDNAPTQYEIEIVSNWEWRTNSFLATYSVVYRDIEEIRNTKMSELITERDSNITNTLDHKTEEEHKEIIYRSLALLVNAFAQGSATASATYINTNTFLQALKTKVANLAGETINYNDRIALAEIETDIPTLIAI